jgi:hypothetical protein
MCSSESRPSPKPEPDDMDRFYRVSPVPDAMPEDVLSLDADRVTDACIRKFDPHYVYWLLWYVGLSRERGCWVGASWAMCDREVFIACPGVGIGEWFVWQIVRMIVFLVTLGRYCPKPFEMDRLSRSHMRRTFWTMVHTGLLKRREETFDGDLVLEIFEPTPGFAALLHRVSHDPELN